MEEWLVVKKNCGPFLFACTPRNLQPTVSPAGPKHAVFTEKQPPYISLLINSKGSCIREFMNTYRRDPEAWKAGPLGPQLLFRARGHRCIHQRGRCCQIRSSYDRSPHWAGSPNHGTTRPLSRLTALTA